MSDPGCWSVVDIPAEGGHLTVRCDNPLGHKGMHVGHLPDGTLVQWSIGPYFHSRLG